jgi:hypothetical protein
MSAGLPGIGLGGLFFMLSALLAPFGELIRTVRGRSSRERRRRVLGHFAMAVAMLVAIQATLLAIHVVAGVSALALMSLPLLTIGLLALVLGAAKATALVVGRPKRRQAPRTEPLFGFDSQR